jgi:FixJ family two-component response regulator
LEGTNFTIFLVDDDLAVLKALGRLLQSAGYPTKAYSSAETFLSEDDGSLPGCVLLDLMMPVVNGLDVQEALARDGIKRPVIFLTGTATIPDSVQAMRAGAVDFLVKPVDKDELLSAVKSAEQRDKAQRNIDVRRETVLRRMATLTPR